LSLDAWIESYRSGELTPFEFAQKILSEGINAQGELNVDLDRRRRCGFPEVIYGQGKSPEVICRALDQLLQREPEILVTRISPEQVRVISERFPFHHWNYKGNTLRVGRDTPPKSPDQLLVERKTALVGVITAGTTDQPIAIEAMETLAWMGIPGKLIEDVGVAGPFRLLARVSELQSFSVIVCVAGMEGALPSVLGGYVDCPVISVPTSVGYGANLAGVSALLSMLNSCASNVAVVNIDAGFKGAYMAGLMIKRLGLEKSRID
jgi:hypothetical protein